MPVLYYILPVGRRVIFAVWKWPLTNREARLEIAEFNKEVPKNGCRCKSQDHPEMQWVQAAELQQHEEQEKLSREARDEQVLSLLPQAHQARRDEVTTEE